MLKLAALSGVPFIMVLGNSMLIPAFPIIERELNITQLQVGLMITLFSIPAGLTIPILGFVSDKIGRKKVIVPALILYAIGGLISGAAPLILTSPYWMIIAGRIVQGIGAGGTGPIAMALVSDIFKGNERSKALGIIEAANGLGKIISPIVGALIAMIIWYALFYVYAFLAIPTAIAVWLAIKEPPIKNKDCSAKDYIGNITNIFKQKGKTLAGCYAAGSVVLLVLFGVLSFLSDALEEEYGLTGVTKGFALAGPVLAMSATAYLSGKFLESHRNLMKESIVVGLIMSTAALAVIALIKNDIVFFTGLFFNGVGAGLVLPAVNTLVTSSAPVEERGGITALYGSVRFFGVAAGPPLFSMLIEVSRLVMFGSGSALVAVSAGMAVFLVREQEIFGKKQAEQQKSGKEEEKQPGNPDSDEQEEHGLLLRTALSPWLARLGHLSDRSKGDKLK
jgi:ACDE family multidrug resistance protein